ncbi:MAG: TonB-dependent receptor [Cytophagaceae bacterium]|nr:TonB-dependent receptor [Gemmatimonadaceae bacterium]
MIGRPRALASARALVRALAAVSLAATASLNAQERQVVVADSSLRPSLHTGILSRLVNVRVSDATVEQALRHVAAAGSARLAYSGDILPSHVRVNLERERIALGEAFREVLRQTDLDVVVSPSGYVIVVRSPYGKSAPTSVSDAMNSLVIPRPALRVSRPQVMDRILVMGTPAAGASERSLASAVSVRTQAQLTQHGLINMSQVFRTGIPGIVAWDLGIAGPLAQIGSVRGSSSFTSNYLKTYVDGVELASPYLLFAIDPFSIDRVEVIRGPQGSAMYGSDAISGVVQVVTRKGSPSAHWRPQVDAAASLGRQESRFLANPSAIQRHSGMGFTGGGNTSLGFGGTYEDLGPVVTGGSAGTRGAYGGARTMFGSLRLDGTARYADIRFTAPNNPLLRNASVASAQAVRPLLEQQRIENETYGITADFQPREWWRQTLVIGLDRHSGSIPPQREPATVADALLGATQEAASKTSVRYSMAARMLNTGFGSATVTVGAEHADLDRERLGASIELIGNGTGLTPLYRERVRNTGIFGQLKLDVANTVFLSAGLRGEHNSNFGQNVSTAYSPMLGLAVTRDVGAATVKVRTAYGKGIRPPAPSMRTAIRTISFRQLANPELEPEVQSGTEGGIEVYAGDRVNLSFTLYSQNAEGLIQQVVPNPSDRTRTIQYQNVGRIHNSGVEIEGSGRAGMLRGDLVYSITNSRVRQLSPTYTGDLAIGDRVPEVPRSSGLASITLERGRGRATFGASYVGSWMGYNWLDYYDGELGNTQSKPLLRSYWMEYPSLTKPFAGVTWTLARYAEWYFRVDNLSNVQRYERDDLQITAGRTATMGLRVAR